MPRSQVEQGNTSPQKWKKEKKGENRGTYLDGSCATGQRCDTRQGKGVWNYYVCTWLGPPGLGPDNRLIMKHQARSHTNIQHEMLPRFLAGGAGCMRN